MQISIVFFNCKESKFIISVNSVNIQISNKQASQFLNGGCELVKL